MFHKKKFTLVEEKKEKKMYSAKKYKWVRYVVFMAVVGFMLLMILANVKSKSYYQNLQAAKQNTTVSKSTRSISTRAQNCATSNCVVTCSGDMTDLKTYLQKQKGCTTTGYKLRISDASFPDDRLSSNWLQGTFNLSLIEIKLSTLKAIDDGAFNHETVAKLTEIEFNTVKVQNLSASTFKGLQSVQLFTLINNIESFSGDGFLEPMEKTLTKVVIKHVTSKPTDPTPWMRGSDYRKLTTIVLDGSNLGGFIKSATFEHMTEVYILMLNSCKINYIADGAFDFMMTSFTVLISLQNNQLKRLAGDYLTKVATLRWIDIQNNPWDCNCQLEDLIREYKKNPSYFGGAAECSTPSNFAGKLLNEVDVEKCDDTTTALTTTMSTTTAIVTTITSTEVFPTTTTTKEPSSSTRTDPITSSLSTLTTVLKDSTPTNSFTESSMSSGSGLNNTTTTSAYVSSTTDFSTSTYDPVTLMTSSTPSKSSTEPPLTTSSVPGPNDTINTSTGSTTDFSTSTYDPVTLTSSASTVSDGGITITSPQTTPSPQNRTTTVSEDTFFVECQRYSTAKLKTTNSPDIFLEISRPDAYFELTPLSQTSTQLTIENPPDDLALIWFYDQPTTTGSGENMRIVGEFKLGCQSDLENSLVIEGLAQNRTYTFCLVIAGKQVVSPFNCKSYCTSEDGSNGIDASEVWLKCEDRALTIGLFIFGVIISMCIGVVGMFITLRFYPSLLKGSKRVIVVNRSTGDVLILPKPHVKSSMTDTEYSYKNSFDTNTTIRQRRFSETSIQSGLSYMVANNYEDIEYRWKMNIANDMIYANRVPKSPAPPLPKRVSQDKGLYNIDDKLKVAVILPKGNDYGYIA